jgi:polyphosphate glucokinase
MTAARKRRSRGTILTVDVGGSHVKVMTDIGRTKRGFSSDPDLSAKAMLKRVKKLMKDWSYDVVSVGCPGPVVRNRPLAEPYKLGHGWAGFDFEKAFGRPTTVVNDALMQALGREATKAARCSFLGWERAWVREDCRRRPRADGARTHTPRKPPSGIWLLTSAQEPELM